MTPTWLVVGWEVAKLTPEAIRLVRDIVKALKDDPGCVNVMRSRALGQASGAAASKASHLAHR